MSYLLHFDFKVTSMLIFIFIFTLILLSLPQLSLESIYSEYPIPFSYDLTMISQPKFVVWYYHLIS